MNLSIDRARRAISLQVLLVALLCRQVASAATYTVTTTADSGAGSLRQAMNSAYFNAGADTITFNIPGSGVQTITLAGGTLSILDDLTIDGTTQPGYAGSNLITIVGGNSTRVFDVSTGTVTMKALTISGGTANLGGGITNTGTLTLDHCILTANSASSRGGAISSITSLTLTACTITANSAVADGGGIYNTGTLTMSACTLSGNSAGANGGGLSSFAGPNATITNCTFSSNSAAISGGGVHGAASVVSIQNCTLSGNAAATSGGGIQNTGGTVTLTNSIVAKSVTGGDTSGGYTDGGHNIVQDGTGVTQGTSKSGDPKIGLLADNGGPTQTFALLQGSPAIDAGDCSASTVTTDQRGTARPQGSACDIGAFEAVPGATTTAMASSLNPSNVGDAVTFTATVSAIVGGIPTGTVQFAIDGGNRGSPVALDNNGSASIIISDLTAGTRTVTATYSGNGSFSASTGTLAGGQVVSAPDTTPPIPNPATFSVPPANGGTDKVIDMVATTAGDVSGVEYYFECTSGNCTDSGWQDSPRYEETETALGTTYTYRVRTRDKSPNHNTGDWSAEASIRLPNSDGNPEDSGGPTTGVGCASGSSSNPGCGLSSAAQLFAIAGGLWFMKRRRWY